ncbi:four helix bundle protein [Geminocystis sp.]|uniref:four helix bundle protein n=1 Tax=Geminocystis sp. TaxID=2664100 RepID=UPI0035942A62
MDSIIYKKAYNFSLRIIKAYRYLIEEKKEFILSKQLLRSGTSIGANIAEANGAISKADFRNKMSIAYKESLETQYWLSLLKDSDFIDIKSYQSINQDAVEISKILCSIVKNTNTKNNHKDTS